MNSKDFSSSSSSNNSSSPLNNRQTLNRQGRIDITFSVIESFLRQQHQRQDDHSRLAAAQGNSTVEPPPTSSLSNTPNMSFPAFPPRIPSSSALNREALRRILTEALELLSDEHFDGDGTDSPSSTEADREQ